MGFSELLDTYQRYISTSNQKLLRDSWDGLSHKSKHMIVNQLQVLEKKEIEIFNTAFQKEPSLYGILHNRISKQRVTSLHKSENDNS